MDATFTITIGDAVRTGSFAAPIVGALPLDFSGQQPSAFGLPGARANPFEAGGFVGDTARGGPVNCVGLELWPHGNGTHTESIAHIVDERIAIHDALRGGLWSAAVITVDVCSLGHSGDSYGTTGRPDDSVVCAARIAEALNAIPNANGVDALFVRTRPTELDSKFRTHWSGGSPPYFTREAGALLAALPARHLLCDLPSIDRAEDDGALENHHRWWGVVPRSRRAEGGRSQRTITEIAYLPAAVPDGLYALAIEIPPFASDAAPSRPLLYPLDSIVRSTQ